MANSLLYCKELWSDNQEASEGKSLNFSGSWSPHLLNRNHNVSNLQKKKTTLAFGLGRPGPHKELI